MAEKKDGSRSPGPISMRAVPSVNPGAAGDGGMGRLDHLRQGWRAFTHGTIHSSIFTLLTTCIGAGTLSLPFAFAKGGILIASVIFLGVMLISVIVGFMLFSGKRYCSELFPKMEVWGYEDLAQAAFGAVGKIAVLMTLITLLYLALIAYMIYARDQLDLIIQFALSKSGHVPDCSPLVNCAFLMAMAFIPLFPVTLLRDLTPMQFTSTLSILCIGYVAIVMTVKTSLAWTNHLGNGTHHSDSDTIPAQHKVELWPTEFTGLLTCISYCSLAFVCHFNLLPLQKELHNPTKRRLNIIVIGSMVTAYVMYNVIIFAGYFNFFDTTLEDIMLNYPRDDILVTTARAALFFTLFFSYPVLIHPTRAAINRLLGYIYSIVIERLTRTQWNGNGNGDELDRENEPLIKDVDYGDDPDSNARRTQKQSPTKVQTLLWFLETWVLFGATFLPASFVPNVGYVWNFVGSIGGTLILYIFPAAFYLRLRFLRYQHRSKVHRVTVYSQYDIYAIVKEVLAWMILCLGFLLLIVENYQAIDAVVNASHAPSGLCFQSKCGKYHYPSSNASGVV